jgi:DNA-binding NarL/FixJ family response regulator
VARQEEPPERGDRLRVLIVEDDALVADGLALQLEALGHEVLGIARDGREALAAVRDSDPDLLLLDIRIPKLDGLHVCRRLMRRRPLPVVMVTGYGDHHLIAEAEESGAMAYLLKPTDERRLDATVAQARARFRARQSSRAGTGAAARFGADADQSHARTGTRPSRQRPWRSARRSPRPDPAQVSTDPNARIRVFIVDDRQLLAEALAAVLEVDSDLEVVGTQTDLLQLMADVRRMQPDVILMDFFTLTRRGGAGVVAQLREEFPALKAIILTQTNDDETLSACVQAGAVGHVSKDRPPAELVRAVRRVHRGEVLFSSEQLVNLLTRPQGRRPVPESQRVTQPLAPRELEVLQALAAGMSTDEVAAHLHITPHTVRTHLKNAMTKLQVHSKLEAVMLALKAHLIQLPK